MFEVRIHDSKDFLFFFTFFIMLIELTLYNSSSRWILNLGLLGLELTRHIVDHIFCHHIYLLNPICKYKYFHQTGSISRWHLLKEDSGRKRNAVVHYYKNWRCSRSNFSFLFFYSTWSWPLNLCDLQTIPKVKIILSFFKSFFIISKKRRLKNPPQLNFTNWSAKEIGEFSSRQIFRPLLSD